ncbi:hypothetical protein AQUCO_05700102v1 [Aquilegia coerulea]|uniref:Uncharacterized protein n=1 Tax=Aquilegia coerulea TaxID=218851 RepID=A0A2G5CG06_AQUCA|nr:hypothetical protein AQUCO_05700102v1 [Aquilegia coerulea]
MTTQEWPSTAEYALLGLSIFWIFCSQASRLFWMFSFSSCICQLGLEELLPFLVGLLYFGLFSSFWFVF